MAMSLKALIARDDAKLEAMSEAEFVQALAGLMPDWRIDDVTDVEYLPGGYSNNNYAFSRADARYVLRIPQRTQPYVDRVHEQAWYARIPQGMAPVPLALDTETGVMLSPWVEGVLLIDAWPSLTEADLIGYLRRLHRQMPADPRTYDLTALMTAYECIDSGFTPPRLDARHLITCHNDLNPWNVLVTNRGWVTLDWEFVGRNDPLFDLVSLHQGLALPSDSLMEFAGLYLSEPDVAARLPHAERAFWLREYGWAHHQLNAGNDRDEIREQKDIAAAALSRLQSPPRR
jgi:aminoglycoside phosphotransferase (APT) family kinase protein